MSDDLFHPSGEPSFTPVHKGACPQCASDVEAVRWSDGTLLLWQCVSCKARFGSRVETAPLPPKGPSQEKPPMAPPAFNLSSFVLEKLKLIEPILRANNVDLHGLAGIERGLGAHFPVATPVSADAISDAHVWLVERCMDQRALWADQVHEIWHAAPLDWEAVKSKYAPQPPIATVEVTATLSGLDGVLDEVRAERARQDAKWGAQNHPDGTAMRFDAEVAFEAKAVVEYAAENGTLTWRYILEEEVAEAFAEADPTKIRAELVQCAAVIAAWIESIDRRLKGA